MVMPLGKVLGTILTVGGFKELLDIGGKFLEKYKDNPLLRTIIESQFRELREEIITYQLVKELSGKRESKIQRFFKYLLDKGLVQYIQDIQNVVFSLVIFETIGVPVSKAGSEKDQTVIPTLITPENLKSKSTNAKKFLEDMADSIGETDTENDYQKVKEMLMSYRLIGQSIMKTLAGMGIRKAESLLKLSPTTLTFIQKKFTTALKKEFPLDQPDVFGYLAQRRRDKRKNK